MIIKVKNLSDIPKTSKLKPVRDCLSLARLRALFRDPNKIAYYYRRRFAGFPPLLFVEQPKKQEEAPAATTPPPFDPTQLEFPI